MTLTVCVGASGSGKTTFLNDVYKSHKCIYIRQYHSLRPYIKVVHIPNFDPTQLPYWEIYETEGTADSIPVGGTLAGEFTAGLSGGQRKLLLFELIYQRTQHQKELLIVLDEPFAGVTDDFVPFVVERLEAMRQSHNILLVTNDHVQVLKDLADNTITVSAVDRTKVQVNNRVEGVDRSVALAAMSLGQSYQFQQANSADWSFFWNVEVSGNKSLYGIMASSVIFFALFIATFWDSDPGNEALVLIGGGILTYFCIQPYLLTLAEWRNTMSEEAEALMHSSKRNNKLWKTSLTIGMALVIDGIYFGCVNAVIDTLSSWKFFVAIVLDVAALTFPYIFVAIYSTLPFEAVQILGSLPFLLMIFFSTTFSPGAGIPGLKELRYLFARFYFWCIVPVVQDEMEGCPETDGLNLLFMGVTALLGVFVFIASFYVQAIRKRWNKKKVEKTNKSLSQTTAFKELQLELYGSSNKLYQQEGWLGEAVSNEDGTATQRVPGSSISGDEDDDVEAHA